MKAYAGIGSRSTPELVLLDMQAFAVRLSYLGFTLRSGGAEGADTAFEKGALDARRHGDKRELSLPEIYLPWAKFGNRPSIDISTLRTQPQAEAFAIAGQFHPAWARCSGAAQRLHARNVHQILGPDVTDPILSKFVICWTKDGMGGGGTGQALRIAKHYGVPTFDLARQADVDRIVKGLLS
ncbi:MAG: hypothetical protein H0U53_11035 [Actinobacteria bacterium]|nr:hypothetical protein [Actinomycetota bacterium]